MCVLVCSSDQFMGTVLQKVCIIQLESCTDPVKRENEEHCDVEICGQQNTGVCSSHEFHCYYGV